MNNKGQTLITVVIFFLFISLTIAIGFSAPALAEYSNSVRLLNSKKSYFLAESGIEDVVYRVKNGKKYDSTENLNISGFAASTSVFDLIGGEKQVISSGNALNSVRKLKINLAIDDGVAFNYGVQAGDGGFSIENTASISGNAYSNGPVTGQNSNIIKGDVISAGGSGLISGIHSTSSVYAHSISNSTIEKDAYYVNISNSTVGGVMYPGSADQPPADLPISDSLIEDLKNTATTSIINSPCPYTITTTATLGPVKINCNLTIKSNAVVTLFGNIWVNGNIEVENNAIIKIDSSLGNKSVAMIADNPSNRTTSSKIEFQNTAQFQNSGVKGSYIAAISQNNSAESGGGEKAIKVSNTVSGDLLVYSNHGEILLKNSVNLKEVTAYRIRLQNTANVVYETGLANALFSSGPGGGYTISKWEETK